MDFDVMVVGAGAVGLACGFAAAKANLSVVVIEREPAIGQGVSSRNSEVIHAGLYYPTGSFKAKFCVEGRRKLYGFLSERQIAYRKCGKLVVGNGICELDRLDAILAQGLANDVEGLELISGSRAIGLEPGLRADAAILSPESGVFDSHGYMFALQGEIESRGGAVVTSTPFERAQMLAGGGFKVWTGGDDPAELTTRFLITAPGLSSQEVAGRIEGFATDRIPQRHLGKGVYFRLSGKAPFERLIYPPPIPGALGTHYRKDLGGQGVFGPDLSFVDDLDYSVSSDKEGEFVRYIRSFWPGLPDGALTADYAGIRPKIHGPGESQPDFQFLSAKDHGLEGLVSLFGIESPGLTSSLAIGDHVASLIGDPALTLA
jgi:L-2-hydroxyglutarate oxidase LhgO